MKPANTRRNTPGNWLAARLLAVALLFTATSAAAEEIQGWWQSWDSVLYVSVENDEAQLFAAGILNPSLVKGELVSWSLEQPLLDIENPQPELQSRPLLGLQISAELRQQGKLWRGRIYDPRSGAWYKSNVSVVDGDLNIRGYIGMPMLGQTRVFQRYNPCKRYPDKVMVIWSEVTAPSCDSASAQ